MLMWRPQYVYGKDGNQQKGLSDGFLKVLKEGNKKKEKQ